MSDWVYERLTPKGKRRAKIVFGIETAIKTIAGTAALFAGGYILCLAVWALEKLAGVA